MNSLVGVGLGQRKVSNELMIEKPKATRYLSKVEKELLLRESMPEMLPTTRPGEEEVASIAPEPETWCSAQDRLPSDAFNVLRWSCGGTG